MKVLLVKQHAVPGSIEELSLLLFEPLALEYVGAGIKDHHDVKLLDLRIDTEPRLTETLESFKPDIIACGAWTLNVYTVKEIFARAKKLMPGILTVVGGFHATLMHEDFFEDYIDVIVTGEGVHPFKKICDCHEKRKSFRDIENIYYREKDRMVFTKAEEHPPLDRLPLPDRSLTAHLRKRYVSVFEREIPVALARASVGCYFHCNFCSISRVFNHKMYFHSVDRVLEELCSIEEPFIFWVDDEFFLDHKNALALAKEIAKAGIEKKYLCYGRSDSIVKHPECIEEWAKIGLRGVFVGMESFKEKDLKEMKKAASLSKNEQAFHILRQNDVQLRANFIIQPDYDKEDFKNLAGYVRQLGVDYPTFSVSTPLPGTELWEQKKGELITKNYNLFDFLHVVQPTKLPLKNFYKEYIGVYKRINTLKTKIKLFKQLDPKARKRALHIVKKMHRRMKHAYRDYE